MLQRGRRCPEKWVQANVVEIGQPHGRCFLSPHPTLPPSGGGLGGGTTGVLHLLPAPQKSAHLDTVFENEYNAATMNAGVVQW